MAPPRLVVSGETSVAQARRQLHEHGLTGAPVVDREGRFEGSLSLESLRKTESGEERRVGALVDPAAPTVSESAHLDVAVEAMTTAAQHWVPALDNERKVVGTIATSDVVRGYRLGLLASLQQMDPADPEGDAGGSDRVEVASGSLLADRPLRDAGLPLSVIITTIQRDRDLVVPNGDTVLVTGDELMLIGNAGDITAVHHLATATAGSTPLSGQGGASDGSHRRALGGGADERSQDGTAGDPR
jgi:CBS domain-containing protein